MSAFRDSFNALPAIPLPENSCLKRSEIFGPNSEKHFRKDGVGGGLLEATPALNRHEASLTKKIAPKTRITILDHPYLETSYSRQKSCPYLRLIHHKYRHAAVAVDCRSIVVRSLLFWSLSGFTVSWACHAPRSRSPVPTPRRRALSPACRCP